MDISSITAQNLSMIQSAVQMSLISKVNNATAEALSVMLQGMVEGNRQMEISVNRNVGVRFDAKV